MASQRSKFSIAELFSNSDGKTSGSGFIGILVGIIGCFAFVTATIGYIYGLPDTISVMQQSTIFIGAASALLAARKFAPGAASLEVQEPQAQAPIQTPVITNDPNDIPSVIDNTPDNADDTF